MTQIYVSKTLESVKNLKSLLFTFVEKRSVPEKYIHKTETSQLFLSKINNVPVSLLISDRFNPIASFPIGVYDNVDLKDLAQLFRTLQKNHDYMNFSQLDYKFGNTLFLAEMMESVDETKKHHEATYVSDVLWKKGSSFTEFTKKHSMKGKEEAGFSLPKGFLDEMEKEEDEFKKQMETENEEINKMLPQEFLDMIDDQIEDDDDSPIFDHELETFTGSPITINGVKVIAVPQTSIDGGYELPNMEYTYNLKEMGSIEMSGMSSTLYQKIDEAKPAYVVYSWCDEALLYKF